MKDKVFKWGNFVRFTVLCAIFYPAHLVVNAERLLNDADQTDSLSLSIEQDMLPSPAPETNGLFGFSIDSSGHLVIVGAPWTDILDVSLIADAGAAYIYQCEENGTYGCIQLTSLQAPVPQKGDLFGFSVGISGGIAVVSAPENGALGDPISNNGGKVYVFERNQGGEDAWGLVSTLTASDFAPWDNLGYSISIDGDWIVASAPWEDGGLGDPLLDSGAVYVFHRAATVSDPWSEVAILRALDADSYDYFGESIGISGETVVIGALLENGGAGDPLPESGAAYIFQRTGTEITDWNQVANLHAPDAEPNDWYGQFVGIDGDIAVVVASREDGGADNFPAESGAAYVYHRNEGGTDQWGEFAILHAPDAQSYQSYGSAISIKNNLIFLGAPGNDDLNGALTSNSGAVYLYRVDYGGRRAVELIQKITQADEQEDDLLGSAVTASGKYLFAGAPGKGSDPQNTFPHAGAVFVFKILPHTIYLPAIFNH